MRSGVNRNKPYCMSSECGLIPKMLWMFLTLAVLLLLPSTALAANTEIKTQEELIAALEAEPPAASIRFGADISTDVSILVPKGTMIDLDGFTWTVESGTAAVQPSSVVGGKFISAKKGTIRTMTALFLEHAAAGETVKSVTYADGETDESANYIAESAVTADGSVCLYLKSGKTVKRVTTAQASYRLGTADAARLSLTYTITYNLDGGRLENGTNPIEYTAADAAITLINPTREGYVFLGWTGTGLTEPAETVTIPMQSTGKRSYLALWEEIPQEERPTQSGGSGSRPSGGGIGGSFSATAGSFGSASLNETAESAEEESTEEQPAETAQTPSAPQQSSRRISKASSSVKTEFHGAKPVVKELQSQNSAPKRNQSRLFLGAGLLLGSLIGTILLIGKKNGER